MHKIIINKLKRIRNGEKPRVLDLFAGCGGLSLGFHKAGFNITGAVEIDELATQTHALNFHSSITHKDLYEKHSTAKDIVSLEPQELVETLNLGQTVSDCVDVIIGGPPCQAFTRVGRAKLREIAKHPEAFLKDPRSNLYLRYLHYVSKFKPVALLMENVPDVMNFGGHNVAEEVCETLELLGYTSKYTLMNSVYYGVPEMRERMFLIAYAKGFNAEIIFPNPTHWVDLPKGYFGSRQVALKTIKNNDLHNYIDPPEPTKCLSSAITAQQAIHDLPPITLHLEGKLKRGARRFVNLTPYDKRRKISPYAKLMKKWPTFSNNKGVYDHLIRYLPRDYPIFKRMDHGNQYPEAHQHALNLLQERIYDLKIEGVKIKEGTALFEKLKKKIVPPYDPKKFPNKWRKMEPDKPARTLMAHLGKDGYSHIHYDCEQARTISIREAARLQSFPDGFVFCGTMNPAFKQIGNAVPPLMANAVAKEMRNTIEKLIQFLECEDGQEAKVTAA